MLQPETFQRLQSLVLEIGTVIGRATGQQSYEDGIKVIRESVRDPATSPSPWLYAMARSIYPVNIPESEAMRPEHFYDILGLVDTREKAEAVLLSMPEEMAPEIEKFLNHVLKELLPRMRGSMLSMAKELPYKRGGGRKRIVPDEEECRLICKEIADLVEEGEDIGVAQRIVATARKTKLRTIQRIWQTRKDLKGKRR